MTNNKFIDVSAGWFKSIAIDTGGNLWYWGRRLISTTDQPSGQDGLIPSSYKSLINWLHAECGYYHAVGIKKDNSIWAWGRNWEGQIGDSTNNHQGVPIQIGHNNLWTKINGKWFFTLALSKTGQKETTSIRVNSEHTNFISIYPNPAEDFITIQLSNKGLQPFAAGDKVQIFDILGIEIMYELIHPMTASHLMNVKKLLAGVYFIRVGDKVEKFVKM